MLLGALVTIYCENLMEHTDTLCRHNEVRTSQEAYYVSAIEPNRLMLFRGTVAVYVRTIRNTQIHFPIICTNSDRTSRETHYIGTSML
jgi:hypothetical protein